MNEGKQIISVFGSSKGSEGQTAYENAYAIGKELAENGFIVANGGYGGTMLASAKGAIETGGHTIGVSCTAFKRSEPNQYINEIIETDNLQQRLQTLVDIANGYIVLPGGTGTLLELAHVWEFKNKHFLQGDKPIIIFSDFWRPLVDMMAQIDDKAVKCIKIADTPQQAVKLLMQ